LLEGAKQEMDVENVVLKSVSEACQENQESGMRIVKSAESTILRKFDHLLYLPILGLERPRCLYYYQGDGLNCLHGFTYKYMPLEQFLGELTHLKIGYPMASALANCYSQKVYPGDDPLFIYVDWHSKPHWTKHYYHSGHVTMWHRIMPGTKQLVINGPGGWIVIGLNYQIDNHFSNVLVDLEEDLVTTLKRPIAYTIVDGEGGGAPLGERYISAERHYISVISGYYSLQKFETLDQWQPVTNDPAHEVISATWADPKKKEEECRQLVLMRPVNKIDPTRIYTGNIPDYVAIVDIPYLFRARWINQERRFREMIAAANLNVNYGYLYNKVASRTRQREQVEVRQKLETTQSKLGHKQEILTNLQVKSDQLKVVYTEKSSQLQKEIGTLQETFKQREQDNKPIKRCQQSINKRERQITQLETSHNKRQLSLSTKITEQQQNCTQLELTLEKHQKTYDEIDTDTLCRERDLEKDQIMFNLQIMVTNLHQWVKENYFPPEWQNLELNKARDMIYSKSGTVRWFKDRVEIVFQPYRYADQQRAMQATCSRFNQANIRWRDGRLLSISVADQP